MTHMHKKKWNSVSLPKSKVLLKSSHAHSFVCILYIVACMLHWQDGGTATKTKWPKKPKIFTIRTWQKNFWWGKASANEADRIWRKERDMRWVSEVDVGVSSCVAWQAMIKDFRFDCYWERRLWKVLNRGSD